MPRTRSTKSLWKDKTDRIVKRLGGEVGVQMQWSALQSERISVAPDSPDSAPPDWMRTWLHSPSSEWTLNPHLIAPTPAPANSPSTSPASSSTSPADTSIFNFSHIQIQFQFQQLRLHKTSLATVFYGSNKLWSKCTGRTKHKSRTKYLQTSHLLPLNCNHSNNGIPHIFLEVIFCREGRLRRGELQRAKMQRVSNSSKSNFLPNHLFLKTGTRGQRSSNFCNISSKFLSVNLFKVQGVISIGPVLLLTCQFNASPGANCCKVNLCFETDFTHFELKMKLSRWQESFSHWSRW